MDYALIQHIKNTIDDEELGYDFEVVKVEDTNGISGVSIFQLCQIFLYYPYWFIDEDGSPYFNPDDGIEKFQIKEIEGKQVIY